MIPPSEARKYDASATLFTVPEGRETFNLESAAQSEKLFG